MTWSAYLWTFRIKSPLHLGYIKTQHFSSTRHYVYGRILWGAITAKLTQMFGITKYNEVGDFINTVMKFGYLFPYLKEGGQTKDQLYYPRYTETGIKYGDHDASISKNDFEKMFISSKASIAIDPNLNSTEEGMLFHIEFINPYTISDKNKENNGGKTIYLRGIVWIKSDSKNGFTLECNSNNISISHKTKNFEITKNLDKIVNNLQVGGERGSGYGLIELSKEGIERLNIEKKILSPFSGKWEEKNGEVVINIDENEALWSHLKCSDDQPLKGDFEQLLGRDWGSKGDGTYLDNFGSYCWKPGSIITKNNFIKVGDYGIWEVLLD